MNDQIMKVPLKLSQLSRLFARLEVLVVDDVLVARRNLKALLLQLGLEAERIYEASSLPEAVEVLESQRFHFLVLDYWIGTEKCVGMFDHLSRLDYDPVVLMMTSDLTADQILILKDKGVKDVLLKPLNLHAVSTAFNRQVGRAILVK